MSCTGMHLLTAVYSMMSIRCAGLYFLFYFVLLYLCNNNFTTRINALYKFTAYCSISCTVVHMVPFVHD